MNSIAGVFYYDRRPVPQSDEDAISRFVAQEGSNRVAGFRIPGLLMTQIALGTDAGDAGVACSSAGDACVWDGILHNRADLLRDLQRDFGGVASGDGALVIRAVRTGGIGRLRSFVGDWSLAVWVNYSQEIVLASDYAGIRPLYYNATSDCVRWSSSLGHLARWTGIDDFDLGYAAQFLQSRSVRLRTPYCGIYPVPPGQAVRVSAASVKTERFWQFPADEEITLPRDGDYEDQLNALFEEAVAVRLPSDSSTICAELSGGLDSSSVVCMARRLLGPSAPLATFSYTHPGCTDERYFALVESLCGASGIHLDLRHFPLINSHQSGRDSPVWWQPKLIKLSTEMEALESLVLLTGQLGDFIMGNTGDDSDQVADCLRRGDFRRALRESIEWSRALELPIYSILFRSFATAFFGRTTPEISVALRGPTGPFTEADSLTARTRQLASSFIPRKNCWRDARPSRRRRLRILSGVLDGRILQAPDELRRISYTHPFAHRPLVEFMLAIPPEHVCRPREPRRLMRRAFTGLLPEAILKRRSKAGYSRIFRQALLPLCEDLASRPDHIRTVELGLVDGDHLRQRLNRFLQGLDCNEAQLRQIVLLEFWLRNREHGRRLTDPQTARLQV